MFTISLLFQVQKKNENIANVMQGDHATSNRSRGTKNITVGERVGVQSKDPMVTEKGWWWGGA